MGRRCGADGSPNDPFGTIQAAACQARPGDEVVVHAGVYRERIDPPRGGTSDDQRITFRAADGERVEIRGSEVIKGWEPVEGEVWKATIPDSVFGDFNPFADHIQGDWFTSKGRPHHTGAVYLKGDGISEAASLEEVLRSAEPVPLWFASVDADGTTVWARFGKADPNGEEVEIHVRRTVFYPSRTGVDFITVRGFVMRHAATPWAPPTAEQIGVIGTNWSKGWVIEQNVISDSTCCGIALGKNGDAWDNQSANSAEGYNQTIARALSANWKRGEIGHHIVRNNTITRCGQAGIVGSLGAAFSEIRGNHVYDIWSKRLFEGEEMAGIKFHGAIDTMIKRNVVHHAGRGLWLDWMSQGTRVSSNLFYSNTVDDLFMEVNHGPHLVDNNFFLSKVSLRDWSEGGAYAHNLFAGKISVLPQGRRTPFHLPHSTALLGVVDFQNLDNRFFNNVFIGEWPSRQGWAHFEYGRSGYGLWPYGDYKATLATGGNLYYCGARPWQEETGATEISDTDPGLQLTEDDNRVGLSFHPGPIEAIRQARLVTTASLGMAVTPRAPYVNPDDSPLAIDFDFRGMPRSADHPTPGPLEATDGGRFSIQVRTEKTGGVSLAPDSK